MMENYETLLGLGALAVSMHLATNLVSYHTVRNYISDFEAKNGRLAALDKAREFLRSTSNPLSKIFYVGDRKALNDHFDMELF
jgi:hypothetical protein